MKILAIRTDKPIAEVYLYEDKKCINQTKWRANRQLAETIHKRIDEILNKSSILLSDLDGIVLFKGPGSFTGLRIGASVANALAYAQDTPVVACKGHYWLREGTNDLLSGSNEKIVTPEYGAEPKTTSPKK